MSVSPLPHPLLTDDRLRDQAQDNLDELAKLIGQMKAATTAYTPTNVSTDRAYDANATTTDELADVLGTLIADLQQKGIIS